MENSFLIAQPQGFSLVGQRGNQEDALFPPLGEATPAQRVFMVCDGMGGHEHGEVASRCVAETVGSLTAAVGECAVEAMRHTFEAALNEAYRRLDALDTHADGRGRTMGTTLTFLAFCTDGVLVAHIGDSRVYQFRPGQGVVFQTRDHSLVEDLIAAGELTPEEARTHPRHNIITRAVQPHQESPARATFKVLTDIRRGDLFFLCSDGVMEQVENATLAQILLADAPLEQRMQALVEECRHRETRDNHTGYLLEVVGCPRLSDVGAVTAVAASADGGCPVSSLRRCVCRSSGFRYVWLLVVLLLLALLLVMVGRRCSTPQEAPRKVLLEPVHRPSR